MTPSHANDARPIVTQITLKLPSGDTVVSLMEATSTLAVAIQGVATMPLPNITVSDPLVQVSSRF